MKTIFKYVIPGGEDEFKLIMPKGAEILCVQVQRGNPHIWAVVEEDRTPKGDWSETRTFEMRGTGQAFKGNEGTYIGTFQIGNGDLIYHLFEKKGI